MARIDLDNPPEDMIDARSRRPARLIAKRRGIYSLPFIVLVYDDTKDEEQMFFANREGELFNAYPLRKSGQLQAATVQHTGWLNLYADEERPGDPFVAATLWPSQQEAIDMANSSNKRLLTTVEITWEE